jgi:hypothetical protein
MFGDKEPELAPDAVSVAENWARLPEPHRSRIREEILQLASD